MAKAPTLSFGVCTVSCTHLDVYKRQKQDRIKIILRKIELAQTQVEAASILDQFLVERTFYGLAAMKLQMVNHKSKEVRKEILRSLQKMSVLLGAKI